MNSITDPASTSTEPDELRRDADTTRAEVAETINALAAGADVKSRAPVVASRGAGGYR